MVSLSFDGNTVGLQSFLAYRLDCNLISIEQQSIHPATTTHLPSSDSIIIPCPGLSHNPALPTYPGRRMRQDTLLLKLWYPRLAPNSTYPIVTQTRTAGHLPTSITLGMGIDRYEIPCQIYGYSTQSKRLSIYFLTVYRCAYFMLMLAFLIQCLSIHIKYKTKLPKLN